jgi:hypothetical protein
MAGVQFEIRAVLNGTCKIKRINVVVLVREEFL